jgi:hypothetical protein
VFTNHFENNEFSDFEFLQNTINSNPNPETINDNVNTAPSKRLEKILKPYNQKTKPLLGPLIANDIGLTKIRSKCHRFDKWINKLENIKITPP